MLETIKSQAVSLHMIDLGGDVTGNGISKMVFTILAAVAEGARDRLRERPDAAAEDAQRRQMPLGFPDTVRRDRGRSSSDVRPGESSTLRRLIHARSHSAPGCWGICAAHVERRDHFRRQAHQHLAHRTPPQLSLQRQARHPRRRALIRSTLR